MIEWLLYALFAGTVAAAVVFIAYLTISVIRDYIRKIRTEKVVKQHSMILKKKLPNGNYTVVTGFFDDGDTEISDAQAWEANKIDAAIDRLPNDEIIVLR
ncbi:MAG: hypothetical protein RLY86_3453 [Pseudomonadota bacterium]|jgi:hypothetical protein